MANTEDIRRSGAQLLKMGEERVKTALLSWFFFMLVLYLILFIQLLPSSFPHKHTLRSLVLSNRQSVLHNRPPLFEITNSPAPFRNKITCYLALFIQVL